jgi:integrase
MARGIAGTFMATAKAKLTESRLRKLKPGQWLSDAETPGLIARRHKRAVTFVMRYTWARKRRTLVIGEWETPSALTRRPLDSFQEQPAYDAEETLQRVQQGEDPAELVEVVVAGGTPLLSLEQAREVATELRRRLKRGQNPAEAGQQDHRELTLAQALDLYLDSGKTRSERTLADYRNHVDRYLSDWKERPIASLSPREVHDRHKEIGEKHGPYSANYVMRVLRAVYNKSRKLYPELPPNPCDAVDFNTEQRRDRAIPRDQLPQWYKEVCALDNPVRRDLYLLTLFTGLRRETASSIRVADIDLDAKTLRIPKPKGGEQRAFTVPLSDHLVRIVRERIADNERRREAVNAGRAKKKLPPYPESPWLFPARSKSGHVEEAKPSSRDKFTVSFSIHGLRNSYISAAVAAGVHPYALKLLTNHALPTGDITAGYVQADPEALRPEQEQITDELLRRIGAKSGPERDGAIQSADVVDLHERRAV